jgi:hypothetical protein
MKRSVGVTVVAVLSLIGSLLTLLMGLLMALALALAPSSPAESPMPPVFMKAVLALVLVIYLGTAAWGIATSIGLLMLRNWARLSILVFSVLLTLMSVFSAPMVLFMPPFPTPSGAGPSVVTAMRIVMGAFWLGLLAIGIWVAGVLQSSECEASICVLRIAIASAGARDIRGSSRLDFIDRGGSSSTSVELYDPRLVLTG